MPIMRITDAFRQEHQTIRPLLGYMVVKTARLNTREEILVLAGVLEYLLSLHGSDEESLLFCVLDHLEEDRGTLTVMNQQHGELDREFRALAKIEPLPALRRRFLELIDAVQEHFAHEEEVVFPLLERHLTPPLLDKLGSVVRRKIDVAGA